MDGLEFITTLPPTPVDPARADVACFVGFVARRPVPARQPGESEADYFARLPEAVRAWLQPNGWTPGHYGRTAAELVSLLDVPVPIETWDMFDALFAWDERPVGGDSGLQCDTALGAAVRSFFAEGGRLCYVVRLGDPWPVLTPSVERRRYAYEFLPSFPPASVLDRGSWHGVAHLFGLPGVSFLCLPDLPDVFSVPSQVRTPFTPPEDPEMFIECATRLAPTDQRYLRGVPGPRCDAEGFVAWRNRVASLGDFISAPAHKLREVQLIAAVPLPIDDVTVVGEPNVDRVSRAVRAQWEQVPTIETAFVQLVYPWLQTRDSAMLPGNLIAPDGLFTGLLAASALLRGSWWSLIHQPAPRVSAVEPVLDRAMLNRLLRLPDRDGRLNATRALRDHVSIIGPTARGMSVLSDVTTDDDDAYRQASVTRLVVAILRAARVAGEGTVFANNGEATWLQLRESLENLLAGFWSEGALLGVTAADAFQVRCDRSTMTQADLDAGRLIVRVSFTASQPIVHLTVALAMDEGGAVTLATRAAQPLAAQTLPAA